MAKRRVAVHAPVAHIRAGHFDEGPGYTNWRPTGSGDWLLLLTLGGSGTITHHGKRLQTERGDAVLFSPDCPQDYRTNARAGRWELLWSHFRPHAHWHAWLTWPAAFEDSDASTQPGLIQLGDGPALGHVAAALAEAVGYEGSALPNGQMFALNALERVLLRLDEANPQTGGAPIDDRIQRALRFMADHLAEPIDIPRLAKHVSLSPSRLGHLFKEELDLTPIQALEQQRIERARQLLELSAHPIQQIARMVGFANPFYFSLRFSKHTNQSPRDYRKAHQAGGSCSR